MWSLGYNQTRDLEHSETINAKDSSQKLPIPAPQSTLTLTELKITDEIKPENTNQLTDLTQSTISECSLSTKDSEPGEESLKDIKRTLSNTSASDSETVNLNQSECDDSLNTSKNRTQDLEEEFVLIDSNQFGASLKKNTSENEFILKEGFKWQRELIFRSKLTMHTSFDRKDNSDPASVTALSISKDNKTIYVGDSRGRVYTWVCTPHPGRADHWVRDEVVESCKNKKCNVKFSINVRKHHCRDCGGIFCDKCTKYETNIPRLQIFKPVRVCIECYINIKAEEALMPNESVKSS